jgi:general secretion pathway protein D
LSPASSPTPAAAPNTVNPFQTIERKDVGLTLQGQAADQRKRHRQAHHLPGSVQRAGLNHQLASGPTTNKRSIESNVLVATAPSWCWAGCCQDEYSGNQEKVPGLGDVPLFGNLFKSETRSRKKTNLMVFLRPVVVRDAAAPTEFSMDRYDLMRWPDSGPTRVQCAGAG